MKHLSRKITCTLLLTSMLLSMQACGGEAVSSDTTTAPAGDTTTAEPEYQLPEADFGGETFNVYLWSLSKLPVEEENGDILNDAIYARNRAVEDELNVNIELIPLTGNDRNSPAVLEKYILAQEDVITYGMQMQAGLSKLLTTEGMLVDLKSIPTLDLSKS